MKKLCAILVLFQMMVVEPRVGSTFESLEHENTQKPDQVTTTLARKEGKRTKKVTWSLTSDEENQSRKPYSMQKKAKKIATVSVDENEKNQDQQEERRKEAQREARKEAKEKSKSQAAKVTEVSVDQKAKNNALKKGLAQLQADKVVVDVFKQIGLHEDFQEIMNKVSRNADEEVSQEDLNNVQNFLKNLVVQKAALQKVDSRTLDSFLTKFKKIVQENFSNLSLPEFGQFFDQVATMKKEAMESETKKPVSKKSISASSYSSSSAPKKEGRRHFGKGLMLSGEGKTSGVGLIFGLAFAAAIFVLIQDLANPAQ
jgi:hypothetical protein